MVNKNTGNWSVPSTKYIKGWSLYMYSDQPLIYFVDGTDQLPVFLLTIRYAAFYFNPLCSLRDDYLHSYYSRSIEFCSNL